jgi:hypothetical protein
MDEQDRGVPNGLVALCGHRNPPRAHFCDVCGAPTVGQPFTLAPTGALWSMMSGQG